ncbi:MAG: M48 family peptidase, partial [Dokdonella sp.]|nr:M48 family peptidase [Dokdonella sp.]
LAYADALLGRADADSARKALDLLRPLLARNADDAELQRAFARANQLAGDKVRAAEAFAEAAWLTGHAEDALNQLKALAKRDDLSYYERSRVEARIARLTPEVLALRKRNSPSEPDDKDSKLACCRPSAF